MENLRDAFNSYKVETVSAEGLIIDINGIECYGLWGFVKKISLQDKIIYKGIGKSIFVDKNHDLSYYINGSDYVDPNVITNPEIPDLSNPETFGYEWGGYRTETGITATAVGSGLSNTNSLIAKNLQPMISRWQTVWDKIKEFRSSHSEQWFLPSKDELDLIYEARRNLSNLSTSTHPYYWSSSEYNPYFTWTQSFDAGGQDYNYKYFRLFRSRLCRQY